MKRIVCKIKGHRFTAIKKESIHIKQYECSQCKEKFTTDGYGQIVRLSKYWETNNLFFESYFQKKIVS